MKTGACFWLLASLVACSKGIVVNATLAAKCLSEVNKVTQAYCMSQTTCMYSEIDLSHEQMKALNDAKITPVMVDLERFCWFYEEMVAGGYYDLCVTPEANSDFYALFEITFGKVYSEAVCSATTKVPSPIIPPTPTPPIPPTPSPSPPTPAPSAPTPTPPPTSAPTSSPSEVIPPPADGDKDLLFIVIILLVGVGCACCCALWLMFFCLRGRWRNITNSKLDSPLLTIDNEREMTASGADHPPPSSVIDSDNGAPVSRNGSYMSDNSTNRRDDEKCRAVLTFVSQRLYTDDRVLGKGQFGTVRMILLPNGHSLAKKTISVANQSAAEVQTYVQEIQNMRTLAHPNIVTYYYSSYFMESQEIAIYMEYISGGLAKLVRSLKTRLPEHQGAVYVSQVLAGLEYLHSNGVIHRDIKGDNVLIKDGICRISDFGSSKQIGLNSSAKTITGTPNWMAPEVIKNAGKVAHDEKVDVWSLGALTVEVLNQGKPPWKILDSQWSTLYHIANSEGMPDEIPGDLSPLCVDFLTLCFQRDVKRRPTCKTLRTHPWLKSEKHSLTIASVDPHIAHMMETNRLPDNSSAEKLSFPTTCSTLSVPVSSPTAPKESSCCSTVPIPEAQMNSLSGVRTVDSKLPETLCFTPPPPGGDVSEEVETVRYRTNSECIPTLAE